VNVTENISQSQDVLVIANGLKLHYLDWGNPDAVPIVLLHGLCGNANYREFFACNVANEHRLLAIDQRGHGDSDWAENYGPRDYVLDLEAFIDQAKK
jgi:pimeloyl-ACP methyl ester carboxylesterase